MQKRFPALSPGLWFGIAASLLLHGSLLGVKAFHHPAEVQFDSGIVSVELTLIPSIASSTAPKPVPVAPEPTIENPEPVPAISEPESVLPESVAEPIPPEPVQKTPEPAMQESVNGVDQDGSPEENKGAFLQAQTQSHCSPVYPRMSRHRGEEGVVVLAVDVSASGQGSNIQIVQSSSHARLDKAAIKALEKASFAPAIRLGQPQASTLMQTFNFRLTNE